MRIKRKQPEPKSILGRINSYTELNQKALDMGYNSLEEAYPILYHGKYNSTLKLAELFKIGPSTVAWHLKKLGVKMNSKGGNHSGARLSNKTIIKERFKHKTLKQTINSLGISTTTYYNAVRGDRLEPTTCIPVCKKISKGKCQNYGCNNEIDPDLHYLCRICFELNSDSGENRCVI